MKRFCLCLITILSLYTGLEAAPSSRQLLDEGWRFSLSADSTALSPAYDDSAWQKIDLPHD